MGVVFFNGRSFCQVKGLSRIIWSWGTSTSSAPRRSCSSASRTASSHPPHRRNAPPGPDARPRRRVGDELKTDDKERAEHIMLVDLGTQRHRRVTEPGTVGVSAAHGCRAILPRRCTSSPTSRASSRAHDPIRRPACLLSGGTVSGAPDTRDGNNRRVEPDRRGPTPVRGLFRLLRRPGHRHHHPHLPG